MTPQPSELRDRFARRIDNYKNAEYEDDSSYAVDIMEDMLKAIDALLGGGRSPEGKDEKDLARVDGK